MCIRDRRSTLTSHLWREGAPITLRQRQGNGRGQGCRGSGRESGEPLRQGRPQLLGRVGREER
eukprot:4326740-Prorocentrum_lima.AAC.1